MSYERIKVVEYLEPLMSKELLGKFPDNSAFDFDYSQSSVWSPLVPRAYGPANDSEFDLDFRAMKKLDYGSESFGLKKISSGMKKKKKKNKIGATAGFAVNLSTLKCKTTKKNKNKKMVSDLSPGSSSFNGTCNPVTKMVWNKVLKAASKHFKKNKRDSAAHVRLSNSKAKENVW